MEGSLTTLAHMEDSEVLWPLESVLYYFAVNYNSLKLIDPFPRVPAITL